MKLKSFFSICASAALLAAGTVHLRAQSLEPFNPYGIFSPSVEAWQMTRYGNSESYWRCWVSFDEAGRLDEKYIGWWWD